MQQPAYLFVVMIKYEFVFMCSMFEMTSSPPEHGCRTTHQKSFYTSVFFVQVVLHLQRVFWVIHAKYCTFKGGAHPPKK